MENSEIAELQKEEAMHLEEEEAEELEEVNEESASEADISEVENNQHNSDENRKIFERVAEEMRVPALYGHYTEGEGNVTDSRLGGFPYIPVGSSVPTDSEGNPLHFLAQINCADLMPLENYPHKGMLQFWIGPGEDGFGCEHPFTEIAKQKNWRVVYHPTVSTPAQAEGSFVVGEDDDYDLIERPSRISFSKNATSMIPLAGGDLFKAKAKEAFKTSKGGKKFSEKEFAEAFESYHDSTTVDPESRCILVGGQPIFFNGDPRVVSLNKKRSKKLQKRKRSRDDDDDDGEGEDGEDLVLTEEEKKGELFKHVLLQIDSHEDYINWGDCGVCNFFIRDGALKNKDFSPPNVILNIDQ